MPSQSSSFLLRGKKLNAQSQLQAIEVVQRGLSRSVIKLEKFKVIENLSHHPETEADRQNGGIRHSLRFHVHILANEIG